MTKTLVVVHNPFAKESQFYIINEEGKMDKQYPVASDLNGVVDNILAMTYAHNIFNVKVQAPLTFGSEVQKEVASTEKTLYSKNQINIEVI